MKKRYLIPIFPVLILLGCSNDSSEEAIFKLRNQIRVTEIARLPAEITVGVTYPIEYRFTNIGSEKIGGLSFPSPSDPDLTLDAAKSDCLRLSSLNANQSCTVAGNYNASREGLISFGSSITHQGADEPIEWVVNSEALSAFVQAVIVKGLPANMTSGNNADIEVRFSNLSSPDVIAQIPPQDGFIVSSEPNNTFLTEIDNECTRLPDNTLRGGQSCTFTGRASATSASPTNSYQLALNYNETNATVTESTNVTTIALSGSTNTEGSGSSTGNNGALPEHTVIGESYPVTFTFTNSSSSPATGITFDRKGYPVGFSEDALKTTCTSTLAANSSCVVAGRFVPSEAHIPTVMEQGVETNNTRVSLILNYPQGRPVEVSTVTQVTRKVNISATLSRAEVTTAKSIFSFNEDLLPSIKQEALGSREKNAFLLLRSVQEAAPTKLGEVRTFVEQIIFNGPLVDTTVQFFTNRGAPIRIGFRARRPNCFLDPNFAPANTPANRQINDRFTCIINGIVLPERVLTAQLDASTYNLLPSGNHVVQARFSNIYYGDNAPGGFSSMPIVTFTINK